MSEDRDHGRRGGPALEKTYQFVLWVVPALDKFPRSQRFLLGDRIETTALAVLEGLIEATCSKRVGTIRSRNASPQRCFAPASSTTGCVSLRADAGQYFFRCTE
jgi:hypothetical protein